MLITCLQTGADKRSLASGQQCFLSCLTQFRNIEPQNVHRDRVLVLYIHCLDNACCEFPTDLYIPCTFCCALEAFF